MASHGFRVSSERLSLTCETLAQPCLPTLLSSFQALPSSARSNLGTHLCPGHHCPHLTGLAPVRRRDYTSGGGGFPCASTPCDQPRLPPQSHCTLSVSLQGCEARQCSPWCIRVEAREIVGSQYLFIDLVDGRMDRKPLRGIAIPQPHRCLCSPTTGLSSSSSSPLTRISGGHSWA